MNFEEYFGTVTQKGQVTIPLAVRKLLRIKSRDQVTFRVTEGRVELAPAQLTLEAASGAVKPTSRPESWSAIRNQAREERVRRRVRKVSPPLSVMTGTSIVLKTFNGASLEP